MYRISWEGDVMKAELISEPISTRKLAHVAIETLLEGVGICSDPTTAPPKMLSESELREINNKKKIRLHPAFTGLLFMGLVRKEKI